MTAYLHNFSFYLLLQMVVLGRLMGLEKWEGFILQLGTITRSQN